MPIYYTSCPLDCFDGCRLAVDIEAGQVKNITGDRELPTNGFICAKGRSHISRLYSEVRITHPLVKNDDHWQPLSLDNALNMLAARISHAINDYGSTSIMHYTGSGSAGFLHDLSLRFFNSLGGPTLPEGSICWGSGLAAQKFDFGSLKAHTWDDLQNSKLIILWGRDPHTTNPHIWPYIQKARHNGSKLMVINPLFIKASATADYVLQPNPGSDGVLALAMAQVIIKENLQAQEFINRYSTGYQEFATLAGSVSLEAAAAITGITIDNIKKVAHLYAASKPAAIIFGFGLQRYANGGHTIRYIDALAALTGNIGITGGGASYANRVWDQDVNDINGSEFAAAERTMPMNKLASSLLAANDPPLQIINISRGNPVNQHPDSQLMRKALQQIPLVVVTDMFMTDTAQAADLVLPITSFLEETNLLMSSWYPYLHYYRALVKPPGECVPEYEIYQRLAHMMGVPGFYYDKPDDWIKWIISPLTDKYGLTLDELKTRPWRHPQTMEIPWQDFQFATVDGKYHFCTQLNISTHSVPDSEYPWRLMTPHRRDRMHSQGFELDKGVITIKVNPAAAIEEGLKDGEMVQVITPDGQLTAQLVLDQQVLSGVAVITQGSWISNGGGVNQLTGEVNSDMGNGTPLYDCCCRLQAV
ncbi:MAG: molybdopterin-containing oxidoreductase family protein [Methylocystaceae bacterium]